MGHCWLGKSRFPSQQRSLGGRRQPGLNSFWGWRVLFMLLLGWVAVSNLRVCCRTMNTRSACLACSKPVPDTGVVGQSSCLCKGGGKQHNHSSFPRLPVGLKVVSWSRAVCDSLLRVLRGWSTVSWLASDWPAEGSRCGLLKVLGWKVDSRLSRGCV